MLQVEKTPTHLAHEWFVRLRALELVCAIPAFSSTADWQQMIKAANEFERFVKGER